MALGFRFSAILPLVVMSCGLRLSSQTMTSELSGHIAAAVAEARRNNLASVEISAGVGIPIIVPSLERVRARFSIVEAVPVASQGAIAPDMAHLLTWYRLEIREWLLVQHEKGPIFGTSPPGWLSARDSGVIFLPLGGGEVAVDGITIHQPSCFKIQPLAIGSKYLLILDINDEKRTAALAANGESVFRVTPDGYFLAITPDNRLALELTARTGNRLSRLKELLLDSVRQE
jgi:hypothetical protein